MSNKKRLSTDYTGDVESPFLDQELFVGRGEGEWDARAAALAAESPFQSAFEQGWGHFDSPEMEESSSFDAEPFFEGETGVINGDNRVRITPTVGVPWRWICKIEVKGNREAQPGGGTGVLVSNRHVLTAAHVVYDASQNMQNFSIQVIPALDYGDEPFGSYAVSARPKLPGNYRPDSANHLDWDYALLKLDTAVGKKTFGKLKGNALCYWGSQQCGANSVFARPDPATLNGKAAFTAGYPRSAGAKRMMCAAGILHSVNRLRRTMGITADTTKGQSGSPVWMVENGRCCLVGMAVGAGTGSNRAARVTRELIRQLRAWITEDGETPSIIETEEALEAPALTLSYPEAEHYEPLAAEWSPEPTMDEAEDFTGVDHEEDELELLHEQPLEERFDPSAIPKDVADALGKKDWPLALELAIQAGWRDENELTNLIFFARHPELPREKLSPKEPNFELLSSEWSRILDREVWRAIQASATNADLVVSGEEVTDHHRRFFRGKSGKRLKTLVEDAARAVDLNPGLLGTIMMAETRRPQSYLSSEKVSSYHIGADDFYEGRAAIQVRVPAYADIKWDKKKKPLEHLNDAKMNRRVVKTILFDSGPDAVLATAVYVKFREVRLREIAAELNGDFDKLPLATRLALTRMAMAAGTAGATPFLEDALKGVDIFIRKAIPVAAYQTQRNATVRTAQAMHLSDWIFGNKLAPATQPEIEESEGWDKEQEGRYDLDRDPEGESGEDSVHVSDLADEWKTDDEIDETGEEIEEAEPEDDELEDAEEEEYVQLLTRDDAAEHGDPQRELEEREASVPRLGRPDFWPDAVYIVKGMGDSFLNSARQFHKLWGFKHAEFESLEGLIGLIAKAKNPEKRIRAISHAWDGFIIPLFNRSPAGCAITQTQIEALNAGDGALMDELLGKLVDLDKTTDQGVVAWKALLVQLESASQDALKPFGLTSKSRPSGDLDLLLRRCADLVAVASADPVLNKAVRKSIAGARDRLKRSKPEVDALEASVMSSGFTFTMSPPTQEMLNRLRAAVGALDDRAFRKTLRDARRKLKGRWLDFRGCRIGHEPKYLEAFAILMGTDGCTAPDWWSGYPGQVPIRDQQVTSAVSFKGIVNASTAADAAMNQWGAREVTGWGGVVAADLPERFFKDFLVAQDGVFPVYEVDYSGPAPKEKHTLHWNSGKGKQRWLEAMWDRAPKRQVQLVARGWRATTPPMPTLALHLDSGSQANPQRIHVVPEPEFRDHIIAVKKP